MSFIIEPSLRRSFKMVCAAQGRDMTEVILEFIREYVDRNLPSTIKPKGGRK